MSYMTTFTGEDFQPVAPEIEKVNIKDIAHALSLICRGNGHLKHFYSVAQHSVNCSLEAKARGYSSKIQLVCLLHDGSEAYIADIVRPVKSHLKNYLEIEEILQNIIYQKFIKEDIDSQDLKKMKEIDDAVLLYELDELTSKDIKLNEYRLKSNVNLDLQDMKKVEIEFLNLFNELSELI